ncbi:hypothetical protein VPNG_03699 [Cytospora leucostoma]|uniref:Glycosyl hydrolase n=1 Tax=Cytospora leucostoma TaxID=1230097 RepID=A0A423XF64_9PEZI|nr:hypothetical protein VPNG_03699 [Cytospora leucostoma]
MIVRTVWGLALLGATAARVATKPSPAHQHSLGSHVDELDELNPPNAAYMDILEPMLQVLYTMQEDHFAPWLGTWPTAIDWTAAVLGTHVSGALSSISRALDLIPMDGRVGDRKKENLVTLFFSQVLSYYFGQDHFAIRNEAYDDILWVVLGWLETIQFIDLHTSLNFQDALVPPGFAKWHGNIWTPAFAHRARIFWNLGRSGWDSELCGGGMTWNPRLEPYKNAITNELFISASASMYLYFPGDWNHAPFLNAFNTSSPEDPIRPSGNNDDVFRPQDPVFLRFAVDGYQWLADSGMMNDRGLYTDGFHVSGYQDPNNANKKCDVRNEQVYTYNQGVILTGQINLWKITGNYSYVEDGHRLIRNVIEATGWDLKHQRPKEPDVLRKIGHAHDEPWDGAKMPPWHGLGRAGVLEEACDSKGACSQDSQTFKGIFFHHLTTFCTASISLDDFLVTTDDEETRRRLRSHTEKCGSYGPWLKHNVRAMMRTRDEGGRVGMWWTAGLLGLGDTMPPQDDIVVPDAVDYRNDGVPDDPVWKRAPAGVTPPHVPQVPLPEPVRLHGGSAESMLGARNIPRQFGVEDHEGHSEWEHDNGNEEREAEDGSNRATNMMKKDLNDRGRGRTVETQGSGLALLRAFWEISTRSHSGGTSKSPLRGQAGDSLEDEL